MADPGSPSVGPGDERGDGNHGCGDEGKMVPQELQGRKRLRTSRRVSPCKVDCERNEESDPGADCRWPYPACRTRTGPGLDAAPQGESERSDSTRERYEQRDVIELIHQSPYGIDPAEGPARSCGVAGI